MPIMLSRLLSTFTLMFALVLGVAGVRLLNSQTTEIVFDTSYLSVVQDAHVASAEVAEIEVPEMSFEKIIIPVEKVSTPKRVIAKARPVKVKISPANLPFEETIQLRPVHFRGELLENIVALYQGLPKVQETLVAAIQPPVQDEVKTTQSKSEATESAAEPEFFTYDKNDEAIEVSASQTAPKSDVEVSVTETPQVKVIQEAAPTISDDKNEVETNIIAFDYSGLQRDIQTKKVPTVSMVSSHKKKTSKGLPQTDKDEKTVEKSALLSPQFSAQMTIQGVATDFKSTETLRGFEVRFQDNSSESLEDYGDGEVTVTLPLARPKLTRSMVLLKRGFAPTNTDLILEDGAGSVSVPMLSQELVDELLAPFEKEGSVGTLLVELEDDTDKATVDVPFGRVITLDGNMKETTSEDFRYQLFVGIKAGNALLTYVQGNESTHKIVHIHERELTYESNFYEKTNLNRVSIFQEDLLSREKSPLIIATENVRVFATPRTGQKLNHNTYRIDFGRALLGGRNYLELTHESEPIFVGTKYESELSVPSESFIRHILSSLPENSLGKRCLIQVNLKKGVSGTEVAAESVGHSLVTDTQFLDADGKFYDSASEKTRKLIIFGESQTSEGQEPGGKVNIKIEYVDGSHDYLSSYCSSSTYLVEQL